MNTQQAKFILQGYRPNGADARDATFGAALAQVGKDEALRDWFAREQAFDRAVGAKLDEVQAPAGLREAILAGGRLTAPAGPVRRWWRQPAWMAAAAGIALFFAAGLALWPRSAAADGTLSAFALNDAIHSETHEGHGDASGVLQAELGAPAMRLGGRLPVDFSALSKAGCRSLTFQGHEVLEVCFKRNGAWFHCYIAQRVDFPALAAAVAPVLADRNGSSIASWADSSLVYVVVSKTGRSALERLF